MFLKLNDYDYININHIMRIYRYPDEAFTQIVMLGDEQNFQFEGTPETLLRLISDSQCIHPHESSGN